MKNHDDLQLFPHCLCNLPYHISKRNPRNGAAQLLIAIKSVCRLAQLAYTVAQQHEECPKLYMRNRCTSKDRHAASISGYKRAARRTYHISQCIVIVWASLKMLALFLAFPLPAGKVLGGMALTPCGGFVVYPLGSILVVRSMKGKTKQTFLDGHTSDISCIAMSSDGKRLVSGQVSTCGIMRRYMYTMRAVR